ncbi:hypothetical protein Anas_04877 [Armadillidium nasatum]|uniref:Uncharacterized protein n=1 Tax=Armadillidium nasatum TaxID=96803 RepID=A0A5N5SUA6_9CRUS|nr:hypothetical protein Anas_04877 [Armadillidium nasatum]
MQTTTMVKQDFYPLNMMDEHEYHWQYPHPSNIVHCRALSIISDAIWIRSSNFYLSKLSNLLLGFDLNSSAFSLYQHGYAVVANLIYLKIW